MKEILIKLRQENRYSQSLLSTVLGISRQAYMKYESGEVPGQTHFKDFKNKYLTKYSI